MTQIQSATLAKITREVRQAAKEEGISPENLSSRIASGKAVVVANKRHRLPNPLAVGEGTRTKVNANIGTSKKEANLKTELKKLKESIDAGADTVMDLSTGGNLDKIRRKIIAASTIPVGTVPIYQAVREVTDAGKTVADMSAEALFDVIEKHCEDGVGFITVHCGVTRSTVERVRKQGRILGIVSRGGAFLSRWIETNNKENPLYEEYDRLLSIAKKYDVVLSLGDGLRPGCIADATDRGQIEELILLGELARLARRAGVQVIIEGPGHVPLNQVKANVQLQKRLTDGAPFYVLGPLVTDIAAGYDHIAGAIGGAIAAAAGADFPCYVTASEHLRLPTVKDVREGVIASRIAAHAADIVKGVAHAQEQDMEMAYARAALNWTKQAELSIDPDNAKRIQKETPPQKADACTMCGEFCAIKIYNWLDNKKRNK
ncbi:MAG: phosphomethylpyrimidine synthase ThiC [Planctomycetota bacterium]